MVAPARLVHMAARDGQSHAARLDARAFHVAAVNGVTQVDDGAARRMHVPHGGEAVQERVVGRTPRRAGRSADRTSRRAPRGTRACPGCRCTTRWTWTSTRPGMAVAVRSFNDPRALRSRRHPPRGPPRRMRSPSMRMAASRSGLAPVPSTSCADLDQDPHAASPFSRKLDHEVPGADMSVVQPARVLQREMHEGRRELDGILPDLALAPRRR